MRILVFGAGAVGGVVGATLAGAGCEVVLLGRGPHVTQAISTGHVRMDADGTIKRVAIAAATSLRDVPSKWDAVLLTVKTDDTRDAITELAQRLPAETPVVTLQNGVTNEGVASESFDRVYGGVHQFTCTALTDGTLAYRQLGRVVVGKFPSGADEFVLQLVGALNASGITGIASNDIMADKWLKLVVNLMSAVNAMVRADDHSGDEFRRIKLGLLTEARESLSRAGVLAQSTDGGDPNVDEMIARLQSPAGPRDASESIVRNSTWQNLDRNRPRLENRHFHGPIIDFAHKYKVPVPYNETVLEMVEDIHRRQLGPGAVTAAEVMTRINRRSLS